MGAGRRGGVRYPGGPRIPPPSFLGTSVRLFCLILVATYSFPFLVLVLTSKCQRFSSVASVLPSSRLNSSLTHTAHIHTNYAQTAHARTAHARVEVDFGLALTRREVDARCAKGRFRTHLGSAAWLRAGIWERMGACSIFQHMCSRKGSSAFLCQGGVRIWET